MSFRVLEDLAYQNSLFALFPLSSCLQCLRIPMNEIFFRSTQRLLIAVAILFLSRKSVEMALTFIAELKTRQHCEQLFIRAQNYWTCWISCANGTCEENHKTGRCIFEETADAKSHEWMLAELIAGECGGLYSPPIAKSPPDRSILKGWKSASWMVTHLIHFL